MDNTNATTNLKADLSEELAIVRALIVKNGQPRLTKETLEAAAEKKEEGR